MSMNWVSNIGSVLTESSNKVLPKMHAKKVLWKVFANIWLARLHRTKLPFDPAQEEDKEMTPIMGRKPQLQRHTLQSQEMWDTCAYMLLCLVLVKIQAGWFIFLFFFCCRWNVSSPHENNARELKVHLVLDSADLRHVIEWSPWQQKTTHYSELNSVKKRV